MALHSQQLMELGAKPFIIICFESPISVYNLYDKINQIASKFKYRILFAEMLKNLDNSDNNFHSYFPNFHINQTGKIKPWNSRKFITVVMTNTYHRKPFPYPSKRLKAYTEWIKNNLSIKNSKTRSIAVKNSLYRKRLEAIEYFGKLDKIDVYGFGWNNLNALTLGWRRRLEKIIKKLDPKPCKE